MPAGGKKNTGDYKNAPIIWFSEHDIRMVKGLA